jgi:hypothetical protein
VGIRAAPAPARRAAGLSAARGVPSGSSTRNRGKTMLDLLADLWAYMRARKKFWLTPIIVLLVLFGALLVFGQGSALAPLIYTLF